jgi:tRNA dimethylallyltransferase
MEPSVWLIAGPTASGKSALALRLAMAAGAEVVNADSMQVYRGIERLTAAPDAQSRGLAPHHLYGVVDPMEVWSAGRWLGEALDALRGIEARGRPAVVVGGTGLYFRALTQGLAPTPPIPPIVRAAVEALEAEGGEAALRAALSCDDPESAQRIAQGDAMRLRRALEVVRHTGEPIGRWRLRGAAPMPRARWAGVVLEPDRAVLAERGRARLWKMVEDGALDEVAALIARGLPGDRPALKALGVREFQAHLEGRLSLAEAIEAAAAATRRYVKRQTTWFRGQADGFARLRLSGEEDGLERIAAALETARQ